MRGRILFAKIKRKKCNIALQDRLSNREGLSFLYPKSKKEVRRIYEYKYYKNKYVLREWKAGAVRDEHATISDMTHERNEFSAVDEYLQSTEEQFNVRYMYGQATRTSLARRDVKPESAAKQ